MAPGADSMAGRGADGADATASVAPQAALRWTRLEAVARRGSEPPTRRSGHSLSIVGANGFLFGGCDYADPPGPTNDTFVLRISASAACEWERLALPADAAAPPPRWKHSATVVDGRVYVFGGFHSSSVRFNDLWVFNPITMDWVQPAGGAAAAQAGSSAARAAASTWPAPRGAHSAVAIRRCIYVFGGYGGSGYGRRDFDDLHVLRLDDFSWSKLTCKGKGPDKRAGHQACAVEDQMLVYGGWNSVSQFNDLFILDTVANAWSAVEGTHMANPLPRWNHSSCAVLAIPNAKIFVFGGVLGEPNNYNAQGTYMNDICILDSGEITWSVPETCGTPPSGRSDSTLAYDDKGSRLFVFGGWANVWLNDLYTLDVSSVVGPPYGITRVFPDFGPLTGGTPIVIEGIDFRNRPVVVRFACRKGSVDVAGEYVNDHTLNAITPDFTQHPAGDVQVRVALQGDSFTTTFQSFSFFAISAAHLCFAYGPGVLSGGASGEPTCFIIQARDAQRALRTRGGDEFTIEIEIEESGLIYTPSLQIQDLDNGKYLVSYSLPKAGEYKIHISFNGTFGGEAGPIHGSPYTATFDDTVTREMNLITGKLVLDQLLHDLLTLQQSCKDCNVGLEQPLADASWSPEQTTAALIAFKEHVFLVEKRGQDIITSIDELRAEIAFLKDSSINMTKELELLQSIEMSWSEILRKIPTASARIAPLIAAQGLKFRGEIDPYLESLRAKDLQLRSKPFWSFEVGVWQALKAIAEEKTTLEQDQIIYNQKLHIAEILECDDLMAPCASVLGSISKMLSHGSLLWESISEVTRKIDLSREVPWSMIDGVVLEEEAKAFLGLVKAINKEIRDCDAFKQFERLVKEFLSTCPLFQALRHPSMRKRHWEDLIKITGKVFECPEDNPLLRFADILALNLHEFQRDVEEITDRAQKEAKQEAVLQDLENRWSAVVFTMTSYKDTDVPLLHLDEEVVEMLESDQLLVQTMTAGRHNFFHSQTVAWRTKLMLVSDVTGVLNEIERSWSYLEPLFIQSEEVKRELPEEAQRFESIDQRVREVLHEMWTPYRGNVVIGCQLPNIYQLLIDLRSGLEMCQQALKEFLDSKRRLFPRFYFVSEADLLDVLSKGNEPKSILVHLEKVFLATRTLVLDKPAGSSVTMATHFISNDASREKVAFEPSIPLEGKVEVYLQVVLEAIQISLREQVARSIRRFPEQNRAEWLLQKLPATNAKEDASPSNMDAAQIALLVAGIEYGSAVENAFTLMSKGHVTAMKELYDKMLVQLSDLIKLTQAPLSKDDRQRTMCMITMDAHSRDIVQKLLYEEISSPSSFLWQSQMKQRRAERQNKTYLEICDAQFKYGFEYLGNSPRLVITPLTDRIYVTATQALHMQMGCAPAGTAGTGKTETTKDLANMLGKICYVFNCSPEMDYKNLGNIFKGLASAGAWGCFDEFNRLIPEVLSVCSVQFKAVCDGIRGESETVVIEGDKVKLDSSCGTFITMNPGYLGRSELPEGLKSLFRPITVMAPDLVLICENMLMAEGFREAKILASKFFSLYSLLKELLSKQDHYDWGLRAVKSVLVVAGQFKRAEPKLSEMEILMRSLRDFNLPKIVEQDLLVFNGLLGDLFPDTNPPRKVDEVMEKFVQVACEEMGLWPHEQFRLKVIQLDELLAIRHCVFIMGSSGSGKSDCCEVLVNARKKKGDDHFTKVVDLNPKAVSTEDLYGYMVLGTREWKDGLLSKLMRDIANASTTDSRPKWIVLDGDLDANWIESMNSVMDDNKMLTLASNERIPLKPNMRLVFEIRDLKYATPATVSRAGILFISDNDGFQWKSLLASWVATKGANVAQRAALGETMNRYIIPIVAFVRQHCKTIVPLQEIGLVQTYLYFLEGVLDAETLADTRKVDILSGFISVWAFGAALTVADDGTDYRKLFSEWWRGEFKHVKFPTRDTVFDYWLNPNTLTFESWRASPYFKAVQFDGSVPMSSLTVPTTETASITSWMSLMVREQRPFMLCGGAGTGKTQIVQGLLQVLGMKSPTSPPTTSTPASLLSELTLSSVTVNFNYYTNSGALQTIFESKLAKRVGITYGPSTGNQLVYFLDDINLPQIDAYGTQSAHALLRQNLDYGHWYDRSKFTLKQIVNVQFLACMNPSAGSFTINPRLQRHFVTFALATLSASSLHIIYATFLDGYVADFVEEIRKMSGPVLKAALALHAQIASSFRKTAANFHYEFNIRHVANVFQGLLMAKPAMFEDPLKFALLWVHESSRVYGDRLVSSNDLVKFTSITQQLARKCFPSLNFTRFFVPPASASSSAESSGAISDSEPILFCHYANGLRTNEYDQVLSMQALLTTCEEALAEYNDILPKMDLVLFKDALEHVARIVRMISISSGHALLVGVGGSGRKSLSRLAAFICGYSLIEIALTQAYSLVDFKADLQSMFFKAGVKGDGVAFLFSDSQIKNERMLVLLNDLLSSGNIPDLYNADEQTSIIQQIQPKVIASMAAHGETGAGSETSEKERCWNWFTQEIKRNLHVILCFSPASSDFRSRARKFPAIVNCTLIDWFQPWPKDALLSVAARYLEQDVTESTHWQRSELEMAAITGFFPFAFQSANDVARDFLSFENRCVYSTPRSYLECLAFYGTLLNEKRQAHDRAVFRLQGGLEKMESTSSIVANMEDELKVTLEKAERKRVVVEELAERLQREKEIVETETARANAEREKCAIIQADVTAKKEDTEKDLAQAQPMLEAAMAALDTLNKKDLGSCKTMTKPPAGVGDVFGAVVVLFAGVNANIIVQKNGKVKDKDRSWEATKKALLGNVNAFVDELKSFKAIVDDHQVPDINWKEVRPFLALEHFTVETIEKKNSAAAGLCAWVINIVAYYDAIVVVEPKKKALAEANEKLRVANEKLEAVSEKVAALETRLAALTLEFDTTNKEVEDAIALVERGRLRMSLARRLADALGSESERWSQELELLRARADSLPLEVLLAASFASFAGAFTKRYRDILLTEKWIPYLHKALSSSSATKAIMSSENPSAVLISNDFNPLTHLASSSDVAEWNSRGLPSDRVSVENGAIVRRSVRCPLLIDPQLQGIHWLRETEKHARRLAPATITVVRQDQQNLSQLLENAVEHGHSVIVENMGEKLEVALWPVIAKSTTLRGRKTLLKMGDKLVPLHADFRLYLHTKLSNPHLPPEVQAETTVVNFAVTPQGLEDQLLALVVRKEWPKRAKIRTLLSHQQNAFKIRLQSLEDRILSSLADSEGDITENVQVIEDLEATKAAAIEIGVKAAKAKEYETQLNGLSGKYQSVACRGALLFFLMNELQRMHPYYVYSLNAFVVIFQRGMDLVAAGDRPQSANTGGLLGRLKAAAKKVIATQRFQWNADLLLADRVLDSSDADGSQQQESDLGALMEEAEKDPLPTPEQIIVRCSQLQISITDVVFNYIRRGMLEKDKLTLATQLGLSILVNEGKITQLDAYCFVHAYRESHAGTASQGMGLLSEWLSEVAWKRVCWLEQQVPSLQKIGASMRGESEEWREWCDRNNPEAVPLPGSLLNTTTASPLTTLHVVRALRPDRMCAAIQSFLVQHFGTSIVQQPPFDMDATYQETSASTPMLFMLFPGVDPTAWVEALGRKFDYTTSRGNLSVLSMGQGQEALADATLLSSSREGGWVLLQNIHLMPSWLAKLERTLELCSVAADTNFRCFLSAEPVVSIDQLLPESLLQSCIKVANEAPTDLRSNLKRAWASFTPAQVETTSTRPTEFQQSLFALCFFHALVLGRRRFGTQGWSRAYSFNTGDLVICADILRRYVDKADSMPSKGVGAATLALPWDDLRYIFGEIMYGGHITDHWDRITNASYLSSILTPDLFSTKGGKELADGFHMPADVTTFTYSKYTAFIDATLAPSDSPRIYGLHPNAEVGYLIEAASMVFMTLSTVPAFASAAQATPVTAVSTKSPSSEAVVSGENARVLAVVEQLLNSMPVEPDLQTIQALAEPLLSTDASPFVIVALQEATRMQVLLHEMRQSLSELTKGLHGALSMTESMEELASALAFNRMPHAWLPLAWSSRKSLAPWFTDLRARAASLARWTSELRMPRSVWISGLFSPTALLTAIKQCTARRHGLPLDAMAIETHVTPYVAGSEDDDGDGAPSEGDSEGGPLPLSSASIPPADMGIFIHGLFVDGARWELAGGGASDLGGDEKEGGGLADATQIPQTYELDGVACSGWLADPRPKELLPPLPVMYARAVVVDERWEATAVGYFRRRRDVYDCPVYQTTQRGPTYVFLATLRTMQPRAKWTLAGAALIMQADD